MKVKTIAMIMATVMMVVCMVSGTLAWLTATADEVKNTFTTSDIEIELKETTGTEYSMVPGYTINKDPKVTVTTNTTVDCYVFVTVEKSDNYGTYLEDPVLADGWIQLKDASNKNIDGVYYRVVKTTETTKEFAVLKDNQVTVNDSVTKAQMNALDVTGATKPTLTFKAYACQLNSSNDTEFKPYEAWDVTKPSA